MRLLNTADCGLQGFLARVAYEVAHAHPQPVCGGCTGSYERLMWSWPSHSLTLTVWLKGRAAELEHPKLLKGKYACRAARNGKRVTGLFYMMFDLLGNDDQALRILTEPYKGP